MSRVWSQTSLPDATPVSGFGDFGSLGRQGGAFRSLYSENGSGSGWSARQPGQSSESEALQAEAEPAVDPLEEAAREGFLQGFREGERVAGEAAAADDAARQALTLALQQIAQAGEGTLAAMLSQAVVRLVGQIMGEVSIDEALLKERCAAVAACMDGDDMRAVLEVNPEDLPLLEAEAMGVALEANPDLARGSVRLATADGWVEDGPDVRLDRLKALLDDMEGQQ